MIENILVHKFGGASVGSATSVRNLAIIADNQNGNILIVVSAMDKTTNALEIVADHYFRGTGGVSEKLSEIREFHFNIIRDLFPDSQEMIYSDIEKLFSELNDRLSINPGNDYDYEYDQIVSYGELFSAKIISAYLNKAGVANIWTDARKFLKTDRVFRDAKADIDASLPLVRQQFTFTNNKVYVCQGFIGSDDEGFTTTLGREGSDYTASVMAYMLGAREVVIWKDVAGIYNIDPKYHSSNRNGHTTSYDPDMINPVRLDEISYQEAIELAYYGAKIIHPKTIKPLQNSNIPLYVRSFIDPEETGTVIHHVGHPQNLVPVYIFKMNQVLISISPKDFSFIAEENLSRIFALFATYHIKANLMQNSAISFSVCLDYEQRKTDQLISDLSLHYKLLYNTGVELVTIRHYTDESVNNILKGRTVLLEQKSRLTAQFVTK